MKIEDSSSGPWMESTINYFYRYKDVRGAFHALIANHAGEAKHRFISKKRLNLLQNVKWNCQACPLESCAHDHRQAFYDLIEFSARIQRAVPRLEKRVDHLV